MRGSDETTSSTPAAGYPQSKVSNVVLGTTVARSDTDRREDQFQDWRVFGTPPEARRRLVGDKAYRAISSPAESGGGRTWATELTGIHFETVRAN